MTIPQLDIVHHLFIKAATISMIFQMEPCRSTSFPSWTSVASTSRGLGEALGEATGGVIQWEFIGILWVLVEFDGVLWDLRGFNGI